MQPKPHVMTDITSAKVVRLYSENWYYNGCKFAAGNLMWLVRDPATFRQRSENATSENYRNAMVYTGLGLDPH